MFTEWPEIYLVPTDVSWNAYIKQGIYRGHVPLLLLKDINNTFDEPICMFANITFVRFFSNRRNPTILEKLWIYFSLKAMHEFSNVN